MQLPAAGAHPEVCAWQGWLERLQGRGESWVQSDCIKKMFTEDIHTKWLVPGLVEAKWEANFPNHQTTGLQTN